VGTAEPDEPDPYFAGLRGEVETAVGPPFETVMRRARRLVRRRSALALLLLVVVVVVVLVVVAATGLVWIAPYHP
jgi:hypothetical protein